MEKKKIDKAQKRDMFKNVFEKIKSELVKIQCLFKLKQNSRWRGR